MQKIKNNKKILAFEQKSVSLHTKINNKLKMIWDSWKSVT